MTHAFSNSFNVPASTRSQRGQEAEEWALQWLQTQHLTLLARNFKSPGRGGGEIDLIMREPDATVVFVEVRLRTRQAWGGAAASVGRNKQRRLIFAARHFLWRVPASTTCRFDVVAIPHWPAQVEHVQWIRGAFSL